MRNVKVIDETPLNGLPRFYVVVETPVMVPTPIAPDGNMELVREERTTHMSEACDSYEEAAELRDRWASVMKVEYVEGVAT